MRASDGLGEALATPTDRMGQSNLSVIAFARSQFLLHARQASLSAFVPPAGCWVRYTACTHHLSSRFHGYVCSPPAVFVADASIIAFDQPPLQRLMTAWQLALNGSSTAKPWLAASASRAMARPQVRVSSDLIGHPVPSTRWPLKMAICGSLLRQDQGVPSLTDRLVWVFHCLVMIFATGRDARTVGQYIEVRAPCSIT